jgi:thiol-disulfide isomerase/thioredoxin
VTEPARRRARITRPGRWALLVVVVAVAVTVAVWPRGTTPVVPAQSAPDLSADRARAALPACVTGQATSVLAGIRVTCLANGRSVDLGALLAGRPTLVNIWATWCQPCQQELPVLNSYAGQPGAIRVIGVQVQSPQADGLNLLAGLGVHLPMVFDTGGAFDNGGVAAKALRMPAELPVSYLVKPDGTATVVRRPVSVLLSVDAVRQAVATYAGGAG